MKSWPEPRARLRPRVGKFSAARLTGVRPTGYRDGVTQRQ
jgi:hypothetical protein